MSLYRVTLTDVQYQPFAVYTCHSNLSIQEFTDLIHREVDDSPFSSQVRGVSVELHSDCLVPAFLQEQAL